MDTVSAEKRSAIMRAVRQKDTKPELELRRALYAHGYRYRLHRRDLPGRPDLVFLARRVAVFVHGCFWHGHDCRAGHAPSFNREYWQAKIAANRERDARKELDLEHLGWRVLTVWECEIKNLDVAVVKVRVFLDDQR